jgi:monofunctional biosynthetic peptidoglycan transglycosylase
VNTPESSDASSQTPGEERVGPAGERSVNAPPDSEPDDNGAPETGSPETASPDTGSRGGPEASAVNVGEVLRGMGAGLLAVIATFYGVCALALLTYTVADPWTTGVQIQRWLEAEPGYEKQYEPRPLAELDDDLPLAVVAAEDTRFFQHHGIDWEAIGEALEENRDGDDQRRGGSSITQQLVKNLFLTTHSTYLRKAMELPLTYMAELILSKGRILELYVNVIEWGPGVYGAEAAAQYHYDRSAARLTRYQAAALAACIPNPRVRRPYRMDWYTRIILRRMHQLGTLPR